MTADELLQLPFLTYEQAAIIAQVPSGKTIDHWVRTGRLRRFKPGRHPLVRRAELLEFLGSNGSSTTER